MIIGGSKFFISFKFYILFDAEFFNAMVKDVSKQFILLPTSEKYFFFVFLHFFYWHQASQKYRTNLND